jgi:DNA-binding transcriptional ArsR family regulator
MTSREVEARRKKVKRLIAQGAPPSEIAVRLDVSQRTVARDLDALEQEVQALKQGDVDAVLRDLLATFETLNTELWGLYHEAASKQVRYKALTEVRRTKTEMVSMYQTLGVLDRAADELRVSGETGPPIEFVVEAFDRDAEPTADGEGC